ncbi:hypothetical protein KJA13_01560 [Patescibacteria group bacterium]|nr:hypothetical protein [Patescibacteria group bacterium]
MYGIELERTFLLKEIPKNLKNCKSIEILDIYIPQSVEHPILRIRKRGDVFEMTKKSPVENDSSEQGEQTISLSEKEFYELSVMEGKRLRKIRYFYPVNNKIAEIDFYLDDLEGLVTADFEFDSVGEKASFVMPDFCLADVTQEKGAAGGILAGKKYSDVQSTLDKYNYQKIKL